MESLIAANKCPKIIPLDPGSFFSYTLLPWFQKYENAAYWLEIESAVDLAVNVSDNNQNLKRKRGVWHWYDCDLKTLCGHANKNENNENDENETKKVRIANKQTKETGRDQN